MKAKTYSALQKAYDQSHLTCSTAMYYESQGNEVDALRCWRECLSQLQGHNTGGYRPRTESERALLQSLKTMQDQCHDRLQLLQTILLSRVEAVNSGQGWRNTSNNRATPTNAAHPTVSHTPPALPERPSMPSCLTTDAPPPPQSAAPSSAHDLLPARTSPQVTTITRLPRTPSPEKRAFLSTLRPARRQRRSELSLKFDSAAAAKAATLAWSSVSRAEGLTLAHTLSAPSMEPPTSRPIKNSIASASTSDLPSRQGPSSATVDQPSQPRITQIRPTLSYMKHRPQSSILPLGSSIYPTFEAEPPVPPPHRHFSGSSCAASSESLVTPQNEQASSRPPRFNPSTATPPIPPPKVPPKPGVKPSRLPHLNIPLPRKSVSNATLRNTPFVASNCSQLIEQQPTPEDPIDDNRRELKQELEKPGIDPSSDDDISCGNVEREGNDRVTKALETLSKGVDTQAALQVANDIVVQGDEVHWDDVAGLDAAKLALKEAVVYPFLRPDLFSGLREPARGMLLFGPPGTGKTMLARAVATESKSTFFSISASSLTSKYLGESEKLVRALFAMAKALAPSIIFVDEIDSLLASRNGNGEHEATRRIKTEFLIQWSDLARAAAGKETSTGDASRVLVLAATNLPWAIDDAARRRFVRRQYIPLPEGSTRGKQLLRLLSHQKHQLSQEEMARLIELTDGFSGSDITALAKDAAMGPLRSLGEALLQMKKDDIRPINFADFEASLSSIRPSVSKEGLQVFEDWAQKYGERV